MKTQTLTGTIALTAILISGNISAKINGSTNTATQSSIQLVNAPICRVTSAQTKEVRYWDAETGLFLNGELTDRLANSRAHASNNWTLKTVEKVQLPFSSTPVLTGALLGGGSYVVSTKSFRIDRLIGYAVVGALSRIISSRVSGTSAIASSAIGSTVNSMGGTVLEGKPKGIDLGFATLGEKGIRIKNPATLSGLLGWLTVAEDLGKLLHTGDSFDKVKDRQLREGTPRTGEPDLRFANEEEIIRAARRTSPDAPYQGKSCDDHGRLVLKDSATGNDINLLSHMHGDLRLAGNLHADPRHGLNVWHYDFFGSGSRNILTALHHIAFESVPADLANKGIFNLRLSPTVTHAPYEAYRGQYLLYAGI